MGIDTGTVILLIILGVSAFLLIIFKLAEFFTDFNKKTRNILAKMNRAAEQDEYRLRRRELCCHYLRLLPFVTERGAAALYERLFYRPQRAEKRERSDGVSHILAPSVIGVCLCAVCLCGASWAWFAASSSADVGGIQTADYSVTVMVAQGDIALQAAPVENGATTLALEAGQDYRITLAADGTAQSGYCRVSFTGGEFYTGQLLSGTLLSFTVHADVDSALTITPEWGICDALAANNGGVSVISDGDVIVITAADGAYIVAPDTVLTAQTGLPADTADDSGTAPAGDAEGDTSDSVKPEEAEMPAAADPMQSGDAGTTEAPSAETPSAETPSAETPSAETPSAETLSDVAQGEAENGTDVPEAEA